MSSQHADGARPDASVIVVTHNNESLIANCLRAIDRGVVTHRHEVIVVDSGSTDRTIDIVHEHPSHPRLIAMKRNVGFAGANNAGIRASTGRVIVLVNSDAFPDGGSIDRLIETIEELPHAAIVGGRLRYPSGKLQPSVGRFPSILGGLWVALFLHRMPVIGRLNVGVNAHQDHYRSRRRVDWVTGAFLVARPEAGEVPDHGFMYGEDVTWASRCQSNGLEVWFDPTATAVHIGRASVDQSRTVGFAQRQRVRFELAWFGGRDPLARLAARGVLVVHALLRLLIYGGARVIGLRRDHRAREYAALLRAALARDPRAI
jgi:N-acetylglucosaminyl-diphospho-decaprenol L-rhamnosyltransferase